MPAPSEASTKIIEPANQGFEVLYGKGELKKLPWHWEGLDPDFTLALKKMNQAVGRVVDIGGGAGTQGIALAKRGFEAWTTDFSTAAVQCAARLAEQQGVSLTCVVDNICDTHLPGTFDVVFDRGCLHVIPPLQRSNYLNSIRRILMPGGLLFLKCFSIAELRVLGPFAFRKKNSWIS